LLFAFVTAVFLCSAFVFSNGTQFLMPGPLAGAHGAIETCSACHTKSGNGKLSWLQGLVAGDPLAHSKACLTCHKMPDTALKAHSAPADVLKQSNARLMKIAAEPQRQSERSQSFSFPPQDMAARDINCATCHQEHQGANFGLTKITNEQCQSCHVLKLDSFDGNHPNFESYPFTRRTRIVYDHESHFGKHFPDVAKKSPAKRIPATCSDCHDSRDGNRSMAVLPFEQTCSACHLDQITGKERVSGPKGIAFLALPGLDLQTLKRKNAQIGEWPDASDAVLSPFMKVLISRNERGRALIKTVDSLDLQDLGNASDGQIAAVTSLVWEIKALFQAFIAGKAPDALGDLALGNGAELSAREVADLTASLPRDVITAAQQQWLPNLPKEMGVAHQAHSSALVTGRMSEGAGLERTEAESRLQGAGTGSPQAKPEVASPGAPHGGGETPGAGKDNVAVSRDRRDSKPCLIRMLGQCLMFNEEEANAGDAARNRKAVEPKHDSGKAASTASKRPSAMRAGLRDIAQAAQSGKETARTDAAAAQPGGIQVPLDAGQPRGKAAGQTDDLLFPTEEELRELKAHTKSEGTSAPAGGADGKTQTPNEGPGATSQADGVTGPAGAVDAESWAEHGGWYRQDYAIFYRPTGHKDAFLTAWLSLTGPLAARHDNSTAAALFDNLTGKDAQGACTKCHSVDDIPGKGRSVNFSHSRLQEKQGRFTTFSHEPHFGINDNRGCLTCHKLEKDRAYLKSYEQSNPQIFASNFGAMQKDLCQTCHTSRKASQDCMLCHKYHTSGVSTPTMTTKVPAR
jgi:hypothetical protein